jgi:hypothetical protein
MISQVPLRAYNNEAQYTINTMQFKTLLFVAITTALTYAETLTPLCFAEVPTNPNRCILTYWTNSGMIIDIANPIPITAQATIYSPTCDFWGETTTIPGNEVAINALGLSAKRPLRFTTESQSGNDWASPKFTYGGLWYGVGTVPNGCTCWDVFSAKQCSCTFLCWPFPKDAAHGPLRGGLGS